MTKNHTKTGTNHNNTDNDTATVISNNTSTNKRNSNKNTDNAQKSNKMKIRITKVTRIALLVGTVIKTHVEYSRQSIGRSSEPSRLGQLYPRAEATTTSSTAPITTPAPPNNCSNSKNRVIKEAIHDRKTPRCSVIHRTSGTTHAAGPNRPCKHSSTCRSQSPRSIRVRCTAIPLSLGSGPAQHSKCHARSR